MVIISNVSGCSKKDKHDINDINIKDNNNISKKIGKIEDINFTEENKSLNPINFESDQISYINYIRDRSYMGELTDLCYDGVEYQIYSYDDLLSSAWLISCQRPKLFRKLIYKSMEDCWRFKPCNIRFIRIGW
mgnify:FL=1